MVSATYIVALVALLGSSVTSAHAHRNAAAEARNRLDRRQAQGTLNGPAQGCYTLPESFKPPTGTVKNPVTGVDEPADFSGFMTASRCAEACAGLKKEVVAVSGTECMCGSMFPMKKLKVDDAKCDQDCKGYGQLKCGSLDDYWSFWSSGLRSNVANEEDPEEVKSSSIASASKASATASKTTAKPSAVETVVEGGKTVFVTPESSPAAAEEESKGPNKVGIAVGVVVGVLVIAAAAGAFYFWHRKTRRNELEEEYKRQAAIAAFVAPSTEASSYDTRLDTAALRRMSDGSIADNQDYSRRILKVTNA